MNTKTTLLAIMLLLCLPFSVLAKDTLRWCAYYNWSPFIYPTGENSWEGILIDELKLFMQDHDVQVLPAKVIPNWKRCQKDVERGVHIDFILGANWTEERAKQFNYVGHIDGGEGDTPAFVNHSTVSAYALKGNDKVSKVDRLEDLRQYQLQMVRGNSFGKQVDDFIATLTDNQVIFVNDNKTILRKMIRKRGDYFFTVDSSYSAMLEQYKELDQGLETDPFYQILTVERKTPVYIAFSKNGDKFEKYSKLWEQTIKKYHDSVDYQAELARHLKNSEQYKN